MCVCVCVCCVVLGCICVTFMALTGVIKITRLNISWGVTMCHFEEIQTAPS